MTSTPVAEWSLNLYVECPGCQKWVDLLDYADFWDGRTLQPCEDKKDVEVVCPECGHEFVVNTVY